MVDAPKLIPFDPKKHKPVDAKSIGIPGAKAGDVATEYSATEVSPDGQVWNIPTVWFDAQSGRAVYVADRAAAGDLASKYERSTGNKFPRFGVAYNGQKENTAAFDKAVSAAEKRSSGGGAQQGALTDFGKRTKLLFRPQ